VAYGTAVAFSDPNVSVVAVNQDTIKHAIQFFSPTTSKKNTLYDCIIAATMPVLQMQDFKLQRFLKMD